VKLESSKTTGRLCERAGRGCPEERGVRDILGFMNVAEGGVERGGLPRTAGSAQPASPCPASAQLGSTLLSL